MKLSGKLMILENTILNDESRPRKTNAMCSLLFVDLNSGYSDLSL